MNTLRHGLFLLLVLGLRLVVSPRLRARIMGWFGARIGRNVRIHPGTLINLSRGFSNLEVGDDVHIGPDCLIDLEGPVAIGTGSTLSPRVIVLSHADPGSAHGSPLAQRYPPTRQGIRIGANCWIGAGATLLDGTVLGDRAVIGAMSLARGTIGSDELWAGVPARRIRNDAQPASTP